MNILAAISRFLSLSLYKFLVFALPTLIGVVVLFGNPGHLKSTLSGSGIYGQFVPAILNESSKKAGEQTDPKATALLADAGVRKAATDAFNPKFIKNTSETVINAFYDWLQQKTPQPTFTLDFSAPRAQLMTNLTAYGRERASKLPVCTLDQLRQLNGSQDILTIPCLPPGVDAAKAAEQFSNDVVTNADFLDKTTVSSTEILKGSNGQTFAQQMRYVPKAYALLKTLLWVTVGAAILFGLLYVMLNTKRLQALQSLAWALVSCAMFYLIIMGVYYLLAKHVASNAVSITDNGLRNSATDAVGQLLSDYIHIVVLVALTYLAIGIPTYVYARRRNKQLTTVDSQRPPKTKKA